MNYNNLQQKERNLTAKTLRNVRNLLKNCDLPDYQPKKQPNYLAMTIVFILAMLVFIADCFASPTYTDTQLVEAIYKAEGGAKAQYPYGIRSVRCDSKEECRKIALRTVRNNHKRYSDYGHKRFATYLEFLGSRYCPTTGGSLSKNEQRLNGNWVKNVTFFLTKGN